MKIIRAPWVFGLLTVTLLHACKESGVKEPVGGADQSPTRARQSPAPASASPAGEPTRAQKLRAEMTTEELRTIREELGPMHSKNRWSSDEQDRYLRSCEAAKKDDASINRRMCECTMEVLMNKFTTARDYGQRLKDHDGQSDDKELSTGIGLCTAAYGD